MVQSTFFDGRIPTWYHYDCFWNCTKVLSEEDFPGLDNLRWNDQEKIRKRIQGKFSDECNNEAATKSYEMLEISVDRPIRSSSCALCRKKVQSVRMHVIKGNRKTRKSYDIDCFFNTFDSVDVLQNLTVDKIKDFHLLPVDCQQDIQNRLQKRKIKIDSEHEKKKRKGGEEEEETSNSNGKCCSNAEKEKEMLNIQCDKFWEIKDNLRNNLTKREMEKLLLHNGQQINKKREFEIISHLADCIMFGPLEPCPACERGQLFFSSRYNSYLCGGNVSVWTKKCLPKDGEHSERLFSSRRPLISNLLRGINFFIQPDLHDVKRNIEKLGGTIVAQLTGKVMLAIFSEAALHGESCFKNFVLKMSEKRIACVSDDFVDQIQSIPLHDALAKCKINSWDADSIEVKRDQIGYASLEKTMPGSSKRKKIGQNFDNEKVIIKGGGAVHACSDFGYLERGVELARRLVRICWKKIPSPPKIRPGSKSTLPKAVKELMKLIFSVQAFKHTMLEFSVDVNKMPLGNLATDQIQRAFNILSQVKEILKMDNDQLSEMERFIKITDYSNQFYTLIPHNFGIEPPTPLNTEDLLKIKWDLLENLKEIHTAYKILHCDTGDDDPMDPLSKRSAEYKRIVKYARNTHALTHDTYTLQIENIFSVDRSGELERYAEFKKLHNRMLLWHGSRLSNFVGIISQGLRIAPPESLTSGHMFGKGIYFADMVSKSANYCNATPADPYGDMYELTESEFLTKLPRGKHSVKGLGMNVPNPAQVEIIDDGVVVPLGKAIRYLQCETDEYQVLGESEISIQMMLVRGVTYKMLNMSNGDTVGCCKFDSIKTGDWLLTVTMNAIL
ncbi:poly [ADP-ribose] polymerase [Trichinella spiralis]|uniref:poly [ADP-ribose] polymerase n=1 Tax=Trichinella spiralis TaxID=6334 RepID=UPI0001EFC226|nr:poly [ADP-ribose] polymerase [Trichinella spiralis]